MFRTLLILFITSLPLNAGELHILLKQGQSLVVLAHLKSLDRHQLENELNAIDGSETLLEMIIQRRETEPELYNWVDRCNDSEELLKPRAIRPRYNLCGGIIKRRKCCPH